MRIERTITISGSTVTINQIVDTSAQPSATNQVPPPIKKQAGVAAAVIASPDTAKLKLSKAALAKLKGGGEPELPDTGGSGPASSGSIIVFGPITLNFPGDGRPVTINTTHQKDDGGGEPELPDTGGGATTGLDTGGGKPTPRRKATKA